jgi:PII-like signaling protein
MSPGPASQLRLYLNASDRLHGRPLYEAVVVKAREMGLAGASVYTAEAGYGALHIVHDASNEYTSAEAPVVVEVVETPEQIDALLVEIAAMTAAKGPKPFITLTQVDVRSAPR